MLSWSFFCAFLFSLTEIKKKTHSFCFIKTQKRTWFYMCFLPLRIRNIHFFGKMHFLQNKNILSVVFFFLSLCIPCVIAKATCKLRYSWWEHHFSHSQKHIWVNKLFKPFSVLSCGGQSDTGSLGDLGQVIISASFVCKIWLLNGSSQKRWEKQLGNVGKMFGIWNVAHSCWGWLPSVVGSWCCHLATTEIWLFRLSGVERKLHGKRFLLISITLPSDF